MREGTVSLSLSPSLSLFLSLCLGKVNRSPRSEALRATSCECWQWTENDESYLHRRRRRRCRCLRCYPRFFFILSLFLFSRSRFFLIVPASRDSSEFREIKRSPRHTHRNVISVYVPSFEHIGERSLCFRERARISGAMPAQDSSWVDWFLLPVCTARDRDEEKRTDISNVPKFVEKNDKDLFYIFHEKILIFIFLYIYW